MVSKKCAWAILALCGSLLTVAALNVTQAADPPPDQGAKSKAKQEVTCRYVESPGSRVKRKMCGTSAQWSPANRIPDPSSSAASPSGVVPGMSEFSNPANQSAYKGFR
jgi:hypothetical protein